MAKKRLEKDARQPPATNSTSFFMGQRLQQERERLNISLAEAAALTGITAERLDQFEKSVDDRAANVLTTFGTVGVDVLYVVTGGRNSADASDVPPEGVLRNALGKLPAIERARLLLFLIVEELRRKIVS